MRKTLCGATMAVGLLLSAGQASAVDNLYFGAGLSHNSYAAGWDDAFGFQLFGGYELTDLFGDLSTRVPQLSIAAEVGYMDSGEFEGTVWRGDFHARGVWTTAVGGWEFFDGFRVIARAGVDLGDDDGVMVGGGVDYAFHNRLSVRGEYVQRNNIDSLQANLVFRLGN